MEKFSCRIESLDGIYRLIYKGNCLTTTAGCNKETTDRIGFERQVISRFVNGDSAIKKEAGKAFIEYLKTDYQVIIK
ncbi:hypothetical protein [Photobacterium phosphoreum]|uniref:hypothetical protein n=1 Tax=Photobacterium phosphoreum TaxID=659 RepID=UPI001E2DB102|nr:hypothetical protein [Photobacterium phosphoreum]MCD9469329.1 hypothetical protein [Photobacterium phosphoreum]